MHGPLQWQPLQLLDSRFRANLQALATRNPDLAARLAQLKIDQPFFIAARGDEILLGRESSIGIEAVPNSLPPAAARKTAQSVFPRDCVTWPIIVSGLGYGWLWDRIFKLPCKLTTAPGHRPPIYFLTADIEGLWAVLHVMDWREFLGQARLPIFAGRNAVEELRQALIDDPTLPRPKACLGMEPALWQDQTFEEMLGQVRVQSDARIELLYERLEQMYLAATAAELSPRFRSGRLRILGITSRYTTFLQHSMRDWLDGMSRLGHETRLVVESSDHLMLGQYGCAKAIADFQPDLLVLIDHYRGELGPLPANLPCVMWVQDRLDNIYCSDAGHKQTARDYCVGFGRLHLSTKYGFPIDRFMSCVVGVNEMRFEGADLNEEELRPYACDVSYVSHASVPAERLVSDFAQKSPAAMRSLIDDVFQQMEAWYTGGGLCLSEPAMTAIVRRSMDATRIELDAKAFAAVLMFFYQDVNNAMYRHQTLGWLADLEVNLCLWGKGWERHPRFAKYARGVADNHRDLRNIYLASKINIQVTPYGVMHQRLLDGLAAGGFFLLRRHPGDEVGRLYRRLLEWCQKHGIQSDEELHARADESIHALIAEMDRLELCSPATRSFPTFDVMHGHADMEFMNTAAAVWDGNDQRTGISPSLGTPGEGWGGGGGIAQRKEYPHPNPPPEYQGREKTSGASAYDQVAFGGRDELAECLRRFLGDPAARREIADSMRRIVLEKCSYLNISRRMLAMIADDLASSRMQKAA